MSIDGFSEIGKKMLGWTYKRCRQTTGLTSCLFGNVTVIVAGDIAQLPVIVDKSVYFSKPVADITLRGFYEDETFRIIITIKVNKHTNSRTEKKVRKLLFNFYIGENFYTFTLVETSVIKKSHLYSFKNGRISKSD